MSEWIKCLKCNRIWDSYIPGFYNICVNCNTPEEIRKFHKDHLTFAYAHDTIKPRGYNCKDPVVDFA